MPWLLFSVFSIFCVTPFGDFSPPPPKHQEATTTCENEGHERFEERGKKIYSRPERFLGAGNGIMQIYLIAITLS